MGSCQLKHLICTIHLIQVYLLVATYSQIIQCLQVFQDPHIQFYNPRGDSRSSFGREALGPPTTAYTCLCGVLILQHLHSKEGAAPTSPNPPFLFTQMSVSRFGWKEDSQKALLNLRD